ncbi:MAG: MraY family glycosyltransferase, partial [bacterium]
VLEVPVVAVLSVILIAVLLGFLPFNFPRASVFLGDSGSQSLGFIFAVTAIYCPIKSYTVVAMFVPLLALGVPLLELGTSFARRLLSGQSVVKADRGHLYDLLLRYTHQAPRAVMIFCGVALALQVFVFALFLFDRRIVFSILVAFMLIIAAWFWHLTRQEDH